MKITTACWLNLILFCSWLASAQEHRRFISFDVPGAIDMGPTSITPDGKIIGLFTSSDGHQHGFLLNDGEYQTIDFPGSIETGASTFWMRVTAAPRCNHWRGTHLLLAASEDGSVLFALSILSRVQVVEQRRLRLAD